MRLPIFPVAGEALNFGGRRMETIMRVAWLPVVLLLVTNMATAFAALSIANGRMITFKDAAGRVGFRVVDRMGDQAMLANLVGGEPRMWLLFIASSIISLILIASMTAPLIRLSGLGERPAPGVVRVPFGPDQIRFLLGMSASILVVGLLAYAPVAAATILINGHIADALEKTYVAFPDPDSLHTITLVGAQQVLDRKGASWVYEYGLWYGGAGAGFIALVVLLTMHFGPTNRFAEVRRANPIARALLVTALAGFVVFALAMLLSDNNASGWTSTNTAFAAFTAISVVLLAYASLRFAPYAGVAVCRRSMALADTLRLTRGFNILRLTAVLIILYAVVYGVWFVTSKYVIGLAGTSLASLLQASAVYTMLMNNGAMGEWVLPLFIWIWNILRILYEVFWTFFVYGVGAGLLGRLYRETVRAGVEAAGGVPEPAVEVWRRRMVDTI